ncbi:TPA: phage tail protein [Citrobacter amalonaticus]
MSDFASRHERSMRLIQATSAAAGRGMDMMGSRYAGMIAGIGSSLTIKQVADFDAQMRRMGTDAQLSTEEVNRLHEKIRDVSNQKDIRIEASSLGEGVSELLGKTGDLKFAKENMRNMGLLMQAFGVDGKTAAGMFAQFWEKGARGADEVSATLDKLYAQFADGSVSLADIARVAPKLFSIIQAQGPEAIIQMGAFQQIFAKNKGSADETTTSIQAMWTALQDGKNIKALKSVGIDVFKKGTREFKMPFELMKEILAKAKNDPVKLGEVFDSTAMQGITALLKPENMQKMEQYIYGTAKLGTTQAAAKRNAESFNSSLQSLRNEWERFAEGELAKPIQELADALNKVDHKTADNWLQVGKYIAIAGAGAIALRKTFQAGKGIADILGVGKGKGIPKGVSDVFGSGVMPVYVVNMGKGGLGGSGQDDFSGNRNSRPGRKFLTPNAQIANIAAQLEPGLERYDAMAGDLQGVIDSPDTTAEEKAKAERAMRYREKLSSVWEGFTDLFSGSGSGFAGDGMPAYMQKTPGSWDPYNTQKQELKGEVRIVVEGDARIKSVSTDNPGVKLSASAGLSSWEQN